ncbi:MAG: peptidoglycan DD-metalloendopeptidase family protein [Eubacteriales bacterium]|nr:peptidoglycan DD-metalloendopeptidase family protein [Eubacteriales bacterium]
MKKGIKVTAFIISILLSLAFTASALFITDAEAGTSTTIGEDQEELKTLQAKLNSIRQKRENLNESKAAAGNDYENAYAEKLVLENDISLLEEEITVTSKLIGDYEILIKSLITQMYEEQTEIDKLYDMYDQIVVYYYKNGAPSAFELLMESDSLSSFLTKKDYVEYILKYMKKLVGDIDAAKLDLANTLGVYETSNKDLIKYKEDLNDAKADYESQVVELEALMLTYGEDLELTEEQIAECNRKAKELENQIAELNAAIKEKYTYLEGDYVWPIAADYWGSCVVTSGFGYRKDPFTGETAFHNGVDIAAPAGMPVQAVKSGTVIRSEYSDSYGNVIVVSHGDGTATLYAHLSKRLVGYNDKVLQGQVIGRVGTTGRSTANHLHFGVYNGNELVDPADYLDEYFKKALDIYGYLK